MEERRPSFLLDGSVLITGEADRTTEFETGFKGHEALRDGWEPDPLILDDQALAIRVRDRGLLVVGGCGHAGIVNTVCHVQKLTGECKVAGILGGFHVSGPMFEAIIPPTVAAFDELARRCSSRPTAPAGKRFTNSRPASRTHSYRAPSGPRSSSDHARPSAARPRPRRRR